MSKNYPLCVLIEIKHVKEDEEFYVTAEIKDSQVRFQLDSGAKPNVMSAKVYRASKQGLTLNTEKCKIRQTQVPYVGHLLTADGLKIDPHEVKAIQEMPEPESKGDAKRVLGFVQFLTPYLPSLWSEVARLQELGKSNVLFHWDLPQKDSFMKIKQLVSQAPMLQ